MTPPEIVVPLQGFATRIGPSARSGSRGPRQFLTRDFGHGGEFNEVNEGMTTCETLPNMRKHVVITTERIYKNIYYFIGYFRTVIDEGRVNCPPLTLTCS